MIAHLVACGIEGGSWDGVKKKWGYAKYQHLMDSWETYGPPVHISAAGYLGLIGKKGKGKSKRKNMPDPSTPRPSNPFAIHAQAPTESSHQGDDLNELVRMFQSSGGMIQ